MYYSSSLQYQLSNFDEWVTKIYTPVQIFSLNVSYL